MPRVCILAASCLGSALGAWYLSLPLVAVTLWLLRWLRGDTPWWRVPYLALAAGGVLGVWVSQVSQLESLSILPGRHRVEGEVASVRCGAGYCSALLDVERAQPMTRGGPVVGGLRVRAWSGSVWVPGERVRALMGLGPPVEYRNPGMATALGFAALPSGRAVALRVLEAAPWRRALERLRAHVRERLVAHTAPSAAGIARALVLGESGAVSDGDRESVRGAGLAHLVAVSGLHMALLAGLWWRLAAWVARRAALCSRWPAERVGAAVALAMLPATVAFAGAAPSAVRAGLTAGLGWGLCVLGRRPDPVAVTSAVLLVSLGLQPSLAQRPAFLLSIAATAALVQPGRSDLEPLVSLRPGLDGLRDSARTWLATLPVGLAAFGTASPWAVVSNLLGVPFATLLWVPLALLHALAVSLHPWLARVSGPAFETACEGLLWACAQLPALPGVDEGVRAHPAAFALLLLAAVVALWGGRRPLRWAVVGAAVLGAFAVQRASHPWPAEGELEVTFLDVGQGDAAVVRDGSGAVALVDVGGSLHGAGPDPGARAVVPWLRTHRVERIDLVVLSHPHPDHVGGLPAVLQAFEVGEIWDTGQAADEDPEGRLSTWLRQARGRGTRVVGPADLCGTPRTLGSAELRVLAPCPAHDPGYGPNDNSFVLELRHGQRRFLFPGDAERAQESKLLAGGVLPRVDVLKVGHHGSRTSSHADFLAAVDPAIAVVSCGRQNQFGHPHPQAMARLRAGVDRVLRIDDWGGVQVHSDGRRLEVRAFEPGLELSVEPAQDGRRALSPPGGPSPTPPRRWR